MPHFQVMSYLCSTNAVTEHGELYNVDGNSNRVSAMLYGPERVIVIAGVNKIVTNLAEAEIRMKTLAAPANATRLSCATPCVQTGRCEDCRSPGRICCNTVIMGPQRQKDRVMVISGGRSLGLLIRFQTSCRNCRKQFPWLVSRQVSATSDATETIVSRTAQQQT